MPYLVKMQVSRQHKISSFPNYMVVSWWFVNVQELTSRIHWRMKLKRFRARESLQKTQTLVYHKVRCISTFTKCTNSPQSIIWKSLNMILRKILKILWKKQTIEFSSFKGFCSTYSDHRMSLKVTYMITKDSEIVKLMWKKCVKSGTVRTDR